MPVWELLSIFSAAFALPFVQAFEPPPLPLPQTINYATYLRGQLLATPFSTDPDYERPQVAAVGLGLEAFIINYEPCAIQDDSVAYRLVVRNLGAAALSGVVAQFSYPGALEFKEANALPAAPATPGPGGITWTIGTLLPGPENFQELSVSFVLTAPAGGTATELVVSGGGALVRTGHGIPNNCAPPAVGARITPAPDKEPVTVCDPGEIGCTPSAPTLGRMFEQVQRDPARQPTVCSPTDPDSCALSLPRLGARFAEATASLVPGECSVLDDAVFADPAFHDGFLRGVDPAALFMQPLYTSGQDFSRLVLGNELLGIANKAHAKTILRAIHTKHWQKQVDPLQNVLRGGLTTASIRSRIDQWHAEWVTETQQAQVDLGRRYQTLQQDRERKFDPVGNQAVANAQAAIERACSAPLFPPREPDAGLRRILFDPPSIKQEYVRNLQARRTAYTATQALLVDGNNAALPAEVRTAAWQRELRAALDAFDAGNRLPLEQYIARVPDKDRGIFEALWLASYERHATEDVAADDAVRLNEWEEALDVPKAVAAACARDATLAARVEFSWCESGTYPENYLIPEALAPTARERAEPAPILGGESAVIDVGRTVGVSCRGLPGDPFWADDCSCSCNQLIAPGGQIKFCQVATKLRGTLSNPGDIKPIIRDDIYAIARTPDERMECFQESLFDDHFLVNF